MRWFFVWPVEFWIALLIESVHLLLISVTPGAMCLPERRFFVVCHGVPVQLQLR